MQKPVIMVQMRGLNNLIRRYMDSSPGRRQVESVTGTDGWMIVYLADHPDRALFQRDLEAQFNITRSTASKAVDRMVKKGLVERRTVDYDARLRRLVLTPKAAELGGCVQLDAQRLEEKLTAGFSEDELKTLSAYLKRMQRNML